MPADAITTEIIRNAFVAAAEEMNATLIRSAHSPIIYEKKDCAVALLDERHDVLGQSSGLPIFLGNLDHCTRHTERAHGRDVWRPGDIWLLNDSFIGGTHLNDVTVFGPVFHAGRLAGFAASRAHWMDVGAKDPGGPMDSTSIFQEGIRIPPVRVVEEGRARAEVVDLLLRNVRLPDSARGDLEAQIAVVRTGERRLAAILDRYGAHVVAAAKERIFGESEALDRAALAAIPDGVYRAEGCIDDDGVTDEPRPVRVTVAIAGDAMEIDLTESSDVAAGPTNCGAAQAVSACRVAFKVLIHPERPVTGGTFRALSVRVREGSMLAAEPPAPCQWYFSQLGLLIDLVVQALSPVLPERATAASYGDSMLYILAGTDPRTGREFIDLEPHVGGWGAWPEGDGQDCLINNVNGAVKDMPVEVAETRFPYRVEHYGVRADSAGPGRWRGGNGVVKELRLQVPEAFFSPWFERTVTPAWGIGGGGAGTPSRVVVNPGRPDERVLLKANRVRLVEGDVIRLETGGGGGWGPPAERDPAAVAADVRERHLTPAHAQQVYGYDGEA